MNHLAIIRLLSMLMIGVAALLFLSALVALISSDISELYIFSATSAALLGLSGTVLVLSDKPTRRTSARDGLAVVVLFWVMTPLVGGLPFLAFSSEANLLNVYYEATSSLTTTGHSLLVTPDRALSTSLLFWRAILHIVGGIASITVAATILSALNLGGPGVHRSHLFTIREHDFFDNVPRVIRITSALLIGAIVVISSILLISGASPRDAASWAVSAITTGLVDPTSSQFNPDMTVFQANLIFFGLIYGTVGFIVIDNIVSGRIYRAIQDPEALALLFTTLAITSLVLMAGVPLFQSIGWTLSSLSTSGIALSDSDRFLRIPLPLLLLPVLIGGSALSTAGGIKLGRLIILTRRVGLEFVQLGYRGSVQKFKYRGRYQSEETVMGVWVYLVGYIIAGVVGVLIFSGLGLPFDAAIRSAIGTLSNSGHVIGNSFSDAGPMVHLCALLGMILGRLEVIALLPALSPSFWQR